MEFRSLVEFRIEPLVAIIRWMERAPDVRFAVLDPDRGRGRFAGEVIKDIAFYRKYLAQHDRRVFVTGKNYLFVTGVTGTS